MVFGLTSNQIDKGATVYGVTKNVKVMVHRQWFNEPQRLFMAAVESQMNPFGLWGLH